MMRRNLIALVMFGLLLGGPTTADDTDILGIDSVAPNVMILLDSSGSMNNAIDGTPKITLAKQVVTNLVASTTQVRFGVMKFATNGASMVAEIGTDTATIVSAVNAMTTTSVGTPLGDMLDDAGEYFDGTFETYASPIDLTCRPNTIVVVSDGLQNSSLMDLRSEATFRNTLDHSPGLSGLQNITVHTIGFGIPSSSLLAANDFLLEAATNGGGQFFSTDNAADLQAGLEATITSALAGTYAFAAASVPSTSVTGSDRAYRASLELDPVRPFWNGHLKAFQRGADGTVPVDIDGVPLSTSMVWDAGVQLAAKAASSRTIYTQIAGTRQAFAKTNGSLTPALLGVGTAGERDKVIDFIRGIDSFDEDSNGNFTEERAWKLGDVLHSQPVLVTEPLLVTDDPTYTAFRTAQASRTDVLLVGSNDGMLHAFRESDGEELWGYIPPDLLDDLQTLTPAVGTHPYFVDSSPIVADVLIGGTYKTVAVFGERRGGRNYHALDATNTTNPLPLWSFTDVKLGETWSAPAIGRLNIAGVPTWVAFVGGGYDTAQNNQTGKAFFVIDIATGAKIWEYYRSATADDRQQMNYSLAASPTAVDLDGNGFVDRVYAADVGGQVWKFDLSDTVIANWAGKRLFAAAPAQANPPPVGPWHPTQAIYGSPVPALDEFGALWVYFGTGDLNHPLDTSQNRLYGLKDDTSMANGSVLTEASLADVTSTDASNVNGWFIRLPANEKALSSPEVFNRSVMFTTFTPVLSVSCTSGAGPARLYAMQMDTGYAAFDWPTGTVVEPSDSSKPRWTDIGTGIPGDPQVVNTVIDGVLETSIVTSTSGLQLIGSSIPDIALRRILYWREVY